MNDTTNEKKPDCAASRAGEAGANLTNVLERTLPCPFCGSTDISKGEVLLNTAEGDYFSQSECLACGALGPTAKLTEEEAKGPISDEAANIMWNMRSNSPAQGPGGSSPGPAGATG